MAKDALVWNEAEKAVLRSGLDLVISLNKRRRASLGPEFVLICDRAISDAQALQSKVSSL